MNQQNQKYSEEVVALMIDALGGDEQVEKMIRQKRIAAVLKSGVSFGEICDKAKEEGWLEWLRAMTLGELVAMMGVKGSAAKRSGGRLSKDEVAEMHSKIAAFLKATPGAKVAEIASAVGSDTVKVAGQLRKLIAEGKARSEGAKAKTVYFWK